MDRIALRARTGKMPFCNDDCLYKQRGREEIPYMSVSEKTMTSGLEMRQENKPGSMTTALVLLSFCVALLMSGFGIIVPVFPQRLQALGLGAEMLALMEGA